MRKTSEEEARRLVAFGLANGLLHQPPDEPGETETGEAMIRDAIADCVRLSSCRRYARMQTDYSSYDEPTESEEEDAGGTTEGFDNIVETPEG